MRQVTLGQRQGDGGVVVAKGVSAGESVIVTGQLTVMPGAKVRVQGEGDAGNAPPGGAPAGKSPSAGETPKS
jgi:hypothetical protein